MNSFVYSFEQVSKITSVTLSVQHLLNQVRPVVTCVSRCQNYKVYD